MNLLAKLVRNRGTEKDVRDFLDQQGWEGKYARFDYLELFAIQRPGWVQVYKFSLRVPDEEGEWKHWLGVVRDDERYAIEVRLVNSEDERDEIAKNLSKGLHTVERKPLSKAQVILVTLGAVMVGTAALGALLSQNANS